MVERGLGVLSCPILLRLVGIYSAEVPVSSLLLAKMGQVLKPWPSMACSVRFSSFPPSSGSNTSTIQVGPKRGAGGRMGRSSRSWARQLGTQRLRVIDMQIRLVILVGSCSGFKCARGQLHAFAVPVTLYAGKFHGIRRRLPFFFLHCTSERVP